MYLIDEKNLNEGIENRIMENYKNDVKMTRAFFEDESCIGSISSKAFQIESFFSERMEMMSRRYWTLDDIPKICSYFDIDCVKRFDENGFFLPLPEATIRKCRKKEKLVKQAAVNLIRSNIRDKVLIRGKDVFVYGKDFGDDLRDSISAPAFIKIVDAENKVNGDFFIIKIHPIVREMVKNREKIKVAAEKKSDEEILQAYLKSEFTEDIGNGVSAEELRDKFIEKGQTDPCGKREYHKYGIDGREIRISKEGLYYIASILLDSNIKK